MIKFKEKIFAKRYSRAFSSLSETVIRDLIKLILMSEACPQDIPHWSKVSATSLIDALDSLPKDLRKYAIRVFLGVSSSYEREGIGNLERYLNTRVKEIPENYVRRLWKDVYNQRNSEGSNKYLRHMKSPKPSDSQIENILGKLRKIALRLAGQREDEEEINYKSTNLDKMNLRSLSEAIRKAVE